LNFPQGKVKSRYRNCIKPLKAMFEWEISSIIQLEKQNPTGSYTVFACFTVHLGFGMSFKIQYNGPTHLGDHI
jgi:hypothetical protein